MIVVLACQCAAFSIPRQSWRGTSFPLASDKSLTRSNLARTVHSICWVRPRFGLILADRWANWFVGLTITLEDNGDTLLTGPVADQAGLFGLLRKVRDLGMPLLSVNRIKPGPSTTLPSASLGTGGTGQGDASDVKG